MWRKCVVAVRSIIFREPLSLTISRVRKLILLLLYGGLFALLPECLPAAGLQLSVSPVFRSSLRLKYRGTSCSSKEDISGILVPSDPEEEMDDLNYGDRFFLDGYVCQDVGTGKPETVLPDSTWNWGIIMLRNMMLRIRRSHSETRSGASGNSGEDQRKDWCGTGVRSRRRTFRPGIALEIPLTEFVFAECSLSVGWQWIPCWQEKSKFSTFQQNYQLVSSLLDAEDHYVYATYGAELPPPGHAGCYEGPFADPPSPGTLIANRPSSIQRFFSGSSQVLANESLTFRNQVHYQLDCEQQEFWFGPVFRCRFFSWLSCSVSPRCNLLYSAVELKREEKLWKISSDGKRETARALATRREWQRLLVRLQV